MKRFDDITQASERLHAFLAEIMPEPDGRTVEARVLIPDRHRVSRPIAKPGEF